jgi:hypothetical protein
MVHFDPFAFVNDVEFYAWLINGDVPNDYNVNYISYQSWWFIEDDGTVAEMVFSGDSNSIGKANMWELVFTNATSFVELNLFGANTALTNVYAFPNTMKDVSRNWQQYRYDGLKIPIQISDTKMLGAPPYTCKGSQDFVRALTSQTDFLTHYNNRADSSLVCVTLAYSGNNFANQDTNTLYWSACIINLDSTGNELQNYYYCYADAYDVSNVYCYTTSIDEPTDYTTTIFDISPNPVTDEANVSFTLANAGNATLAIYDVNGNQVLEIANDMYQAGNNNVSFNAAGIPSGVYVIRMQSGANIIAKQFVKIK